MRQRRQRAAFNHKIFTETNVLKLPARSASTLFGIGVPVRRGVWQF